VLEHIRAATAARHREVESHVGGDHLLSATFDPVHYGRFLAAHLQLHQLAADVFDHLEGGWLDWPACERLDLLHADLETLAGLDQSLPPTTPAHTANAPERWRPAGTDRAAAVGLLYVVEGSCNGNKRILRSLAQSFRFRRLGADSFLRRSVDQAGSRWRATLKLVEYHGTTNPTAAAAGADAAFGAYRRFWDSTGTTERSPRQNRRTTQGIEDDKQRRTPDRYLRDRSVSGRA
jgi:heme oxygenase